MQPIDQNEHLVPLLKDLIHICLEPEAQERGMTFRPFFLGQSTPKSLHKMQIDRERLKPAVYTTT